MKTNRIIMLFMAVVTAVPMAFLPCAVADTVQIQTTGIDSSWFSFGSTLAAKLKSTLPAGTDMEVLPWGGGVRNPAGGFLRFSNRYRNHGQGVGRHCHCGTWTHFPAGFLTRTA